MSDGGSGAWPVAGVDYPRDSVEFAAWFPDDRACADYLAWLRWGDMEFVCHLCGSIACGWPRRDGLTYDCGACKSKTSVTAGTIFSKTRTPLTVWFRAAWDLTTRPNGQSARNLQRNLGLGSYQTAWTMLHRYRRAMVAPDRARLTGVVELDETVVGGKNKTGKRGRSKDANRHIVIVACENPGRSFIGGTGTKLGRARGIIIPDYTTPSTLAAILDMVEPGSHLVTDYASNISSAAKQSGFTHTPINMSKMPGKPHLYLPAVSRAQAQLKRWLAGTIQGAAASFHLQEYVWEFEFRFNRRSAKAPGLLFYRLLELSAQTGPITYDDIAVGGSRERDVAPTPPGTGGRSPRSLAQPDAGRPWRDVVR